MAWAEILMLQTHQNVSSFRLRTAGMIVWTTEAYCCKSCASLPWGIASHKCLWVQLRKTGNGLGMLARRNSHLPVHSWLLFVLWTLLLSPHQEHHPDTDLPLHAALLSEKTILRSRRHIIWDTDFHSTGSQKWTNARSQMAPFSLWCSRVRTRCPDFYTSCNVILCWHLQAVIFPESMLAEICMHLKWCYF